MSWFWSLWRIAVFWVLALVLAWMAVAGGTLLGFLGRAAEAMLVLGGAALAAAAVITRYWHLQSSPAPQPAPPAAKKGA